MIINQTSLFRLNAESVPRLRSEKQPCLVRGFLMPVKTINSSYITLQNVHLAYSSYILYGLSSHKEDKK